MNPEAVFVGGNNWDVVVYGEHLIGTFRESNSILGYGKTYELTPNVGPPVSLHYSTRDGAIEYLAKEWLTAKWSDTSFSYRVVSTIPQ